ncbi:MAG: sugar phosphate isomerase/epimerase family protein [Opitutaceae bacterium]
MKHPASIENTGRPLTLSGLADEAADDIETQINAHRELGWPAIELRLVDKQGVTALLDDAAFDRVVEHIQAAGLQVTALASAIGNWSRPITGDFGIDLAELSSAIPRMRRLGTRCLRTMSWKKDGAADDAWRDEAIRRYRHLARIAADAGIMLMHENCEGWAGQSARHTREFLERVNSDHVGVLFDIGNTISHCQEPWEYYAGVKPLIGYIHIKDCRRNPAGGRSEDFTHAGEGDAMVARILEDLVKSGYRGVAAIEPHIASVIHQGGARTVTDAERYRSYIEYAQRAERLIGQLAPAKPGSG